MRRGGRGESRLIKDQQNCDCVISLTANTSQSSQSNQIFYLQIAAEVSAPLAKTDEIVMIGGQDRTTQEVSKLCGTLPPAISALTGVDVSGVSRAPAPVVTQPRAVSQTLNVGPLHLH